MFQRFFVGGDEGDRTPYLLNAIQALSQVSYTPTGFSVFLVLGGLSPGDVYYYSTAPGKVNTFFEFFYDFEDFLFYDRYIVPFIGIIFKIPAGNLARGAGFYRIVKRPH